MIRARRTIWVLSGLAGGLAVAVVLVVATMPWSSDSLRRRVVDQLGQQLNADVRLSDLDLHLFPHPRASGGGLQVRRRGAPDEPLITVEHFVAEADLAGLIRRRVARVQLMGLRIVIPPHEGGPSAPPSGEPPPAQGNPSLRKGIVITSLESDDAELIIMRTVEPRREVKPPAVWTIHHLSMRDVSAATGMPFEARLTNAVPPGEIATSGTFGPWDVDVPGDTPLSGRFTFDRADLGVFHGIGGTLSSRGTFDGTLDGIDVHGDTETPDFTIQVGGHPFLLRAAYHAVVDGTNGNTYLKRIEASFLHSSMVAAGGVYDEGARAGRVVRLDISMDRARIEDIMRMAVASAQPPMTGALKLRTTFFLPPGQGDVTDRLRLDGQFSIAAARFANVDVQAKINELSHRSRGQPVAEQRDRVLSNFGGRFKLSDGKLIVPQLTFTVPGADVRLAGAYGLRSEQLDFRGTMLMDATVSQTQTGLKRLLLKAVDPLFRRRDGRNGSAVPFKIGGRRSDPQFGLDFGRVLNRGSGP